MKSLSVGASLAWHIAAGEAGAAHHQYIEKEHLLIGICSLEKVLMVDATDLAPEARHALQAEHETVEDSLRRFELDTTLLRRSVRDRLGDGGYQHTEQVIHRSAACKEVFARADLLAVTASEISCLHLLAVILEKPGDLLSGLLAELGASAIGLLEHVLAVLAGGSQPMEEPVEARAGAPKQVAQGTHYLDRYGRDLTQQAREGKLGPFVGRRKELLQVVQTLARRSKNNPVLVGEAGVGKTAIVEALAIRVVQGKDAQVLGDKRIIELSVGSLVAGTKYRGEFEERLTRILDEARNHPEIILFIDEIHTVVGAGRVEGGGTDAANIMKPGLSRGDLRCIGATTIAEYRRYIESDPALERRFEKVIINESSPEEALEILRGIRPKWEEHHGVRIADSALEAAVTLSIRFDADHQLPDKAIDLVDRAGARSRVPVLSMMQPHRGKGRAHGAPSDPQQGAEVTDQDIATVLSEKLDVPLEIVTGSQGGPSQCRLLQLEAYLKTRLIGQDEAIERVCQRLLLAHTGLGKRRGPLAVFLFLGPTGVGKTETAKLLAGFLFGSDSETIRLDMSEYMEEHSPSKLIGSPPGYVGYDEEGQLTGKLRTKPYSVVLLDEVEKAHPKVFDLFLQVFDEGRLTDSKGRTADARNAIFIMTSNIGPEHSVGFRPGSPQEFNSSVLEEVKRRFRAEFINRIDEIIVFASLQEDDAKRILRSMLAELGDRVRERYQIELEIDEQAEAFLVREGYSLDYGVRELRRTVERFVEIPLSQMLLTGELRSHTRWRVGRGGDGVSVAPVAS